MALTLLIGGARSGKSDAAIAMATRRGEPVTFVATAEARDAEMEERISRHRASRPAEWTTVESDDLASVLASVGEDFVIVDCLTLWISRLIERELSDTDIVEQVERTAAFAGGRSAPTVAITNEVGSGIVPDNPLARRFRDVLGTTNRIWASHAQHTLLVVAGRALPLSSIEDLTT